MGNLYNDMLKYEHVKSMFYKIKRNCKNKQAIYEYSLFLNSNIYKILELLYLHKYEFSRYRIFMIRDPKFRIIMSENINDKIVSHLICKYYLVDIIDKKLINSNVATRINKGSGYAFNKFVEYINKLRYKNKEIYILKIDIKKYFYNIDHDILISKVKKYIKDKNALRIIEEIINSTNMEYVNERINYLKDNKIKYINSLNISKKEKEINKLNLEINSKFNLYMLSNGISFLGYVFKLNKNNKLIIRYNNNTIRRINKRLNDLYRYDNEKYVRSLGSYKGYFDKCNTKLYKFMLNKLGE